MISLLLSVASWRLGMTRPFCLPTSGNFGRMNFANRRTSAVALACNVDVATASEQSVSEIITRMNEDAAVGQVDDVLGCFDQIIGQDPASVSETMIHNIVLNAYAKAGDVVGARAWYQRMVNDGVPRNCETLGKMIECSAHAGDATEALAWWEKSLESGVDPDPSHFSLLLQAYVKVGKVSDATKLLLTAQEAGVEPHVDFYLVIIRAYGDANRPDDAAIWFNRIGEDGLKPVAACYKAVIEAFAKTGRQAEALEWYNKMKASNGVQASSASLLDAMIASIHAGVVSDVSMWRDMLLKSDSQMAVEDYSALISALAKAGRSMEVEHWIHHLKSTHMLEILHFEAAMKGFAATNQLMDAMRFFAMLEAEGFQPTTACYNSIIEVHARVGLSDKVDELFNRMASSAVEPDIFTFNSMMKSCAKARMPDKAEMWLSKAEEKGLVPDENSYRTIIDAYGIVAQPRQAQRWLRKMEVVGLQPTTRHYNAVLGAFSRAFQPNEAALMVKAMEDSGPAPKEYSYGIVVGAFARAGQADEAQKWSAHMKKMGMRPSASVLCNGISGLAQAGDLESALAWLRRDGRQVPADAVLCSTAMDILMQASRHKEALSWLDTMEQMWLQPAGKRAYITILKACNRAGAWERAVRWLDATATGKYNLTIPYRQAIDCCGKQGKRKEAAALLDSMVSEGWEAGLSAYTSIMVACANAGEFEEAATWLDKMVNAGFKPDVYTFNKVINAISMAKGVDDATRWFQKMREHGIQPDQVSWTTMITAFGRAGRKDDAEAWLRKMEESRVAPNVVTFVGVVQACAKAKCPEEAASWLGKMRDLRVDPNEFVYSRVVQSFTRAGRLAEALRIISEAERFGVPLQAAPYELAIIEMGKELQAEEAAGMLDHMKSRGLRASEPAYRYSIAACRETQNAGLAEKLLRDMLAENHVPNDYVVWNMHEILGQEEFQRLEDELGFALLADQMQEEAPRQGNMQSGRHRSTPRGPVV